MLEIKSSGLPIYLDEDTHRLSFEGGLAVDGSTSKKVGQMLGLWANPQDLSPEKLKEACYSAYRNIRYPKDEALFEKYGYRYDITAIEPGTVNGECKKTSGHYHGCIEGHTLTYPEVYEVIHGEIVFLLQKWEAFEAGGEPHFADLRAVHVKAGEAIIIPPFYGHGSINPTEGMSLFSNIAVVACGLHYEPIQEKQGLAGYVLRDGASFQVVPNPRYTSIGQIPVIRPKEDPSLGITFGKPCYPTFIENPALYDYLLHPEPYVERIEALIR